MPKQNVPALRLEGFSGEWELKAIGELFAERNESFPEGELLSVTLRNGIKRFQEIGRHNTSNEDKSKYKLVEVGDIAYNSMRMWQGASGVSRWRGIVSPAYTVLKPVGNQDTSFFAYYFKTPFMVQVFQLNSQGLTSDTWNLKYPALSAIDIYRPQDIEEQQAIGAIFTNLDAAINQHTLKHKALQQAKTALMQRMFPQEGQTVPELRLEGFSGEWEQTFLYDHLELSTDVNSGDRFGRNEVYAVSLTEGLVNQIKFHGRSFAGSSIANYDVVLTGDVVYTKSPLKATPYGIFKSNGGAPGIVSPLYAVYRPKPHTDSHFVQDYFALPERLNAYLSPLVNKGAKNTMNISDWNALCGEVTFPPTLEEQQAIGAVFTNLDQLIAAEAQYIKSLSQAKTALLQRMFI